MEHEDRSAIIDNIDPTLRSHIYSLVSALGGPSPSSPDIYTLGDDVLGCLRDIKRWLKGYDDKLDRLDVARCLSEANLVIGDILEILSHPLLNGNANLKSNHANKISLACVELLVPLTWPLAKTELSMTVNHHRHLATLRRSQVYYKQAILKHRFNSILKVCCLNALPPMSKPARERTPRDQGIIKLVLYLVRNLLLIQGLGDEDDTVSEDISRSSTIESLNSQGVLNFLLSIVSGIPESFEEQDVIILEILFHLLQGVDVGLVVISVTRESENTYDPLTKMLEGGILKDIAKAKSRHTRFGTTVILKKEDGRKKIISSNGALLDEGMSLKRLDATKKWRKSQQNTSTKQHSMARQAMHLSIQAHRDLHGFLFQVLTSGFNCVFQSIRRAIERDSDRIVGTTSTSQLLYVGGVLMEFGRVLKQEKATRNDSNTLDFSEFSSLLQPETFIVVFRHIREGLESKSWDDVQLGCYYFTQALLAVSEMMHAKNESENSVAENILNRLFYEETLQELIVAILRSGRKQTLKYLDVVTETASVYLKTLERYSKDNADMVIKSKRKAKYRPAEPGSLNESESDTGDISKRQLLEKSFEFQQCESKFLSQPSCEPFLDLLKHHKDLNHSQIRRSIGFLHRVFVKRKFTVGFFRLKTIQILRDIAKETRGLPEYPELNLFVQYFSKQLIRKLKECPILFTEILFEKPSKLVYFIEHGREKDGPTKRRQPPTILEFEEGLEKEHMIGIATSLVLQDDLCRNQLNWIKLVIESIVSLRKQQTPEVLSETGPSMQPTAIVVKFDQQSHALLHFTSNKLRLLMTVLGFDFEGEFEEFSYVFQSPVSAEELRKTIAILSKYEISPIFRLDDRDIEEYIKITRKPRNLGNKSLDEFSADEDFQFPDNISGNKSHDVMKSSKSSTGRKRINADEEEIRRRQKARKLKEKERRQGIKSNLYIASSDDDSDFERDQVFFRNERLLRDAMSRATINQAGGIDLPSEPSSYKKRATVEDTARELKRPRIITGFTSSDGDESINTPVSGEV